MLSLGQKLMLGCTALLLGVLLLLGGTLLPARLRSYGEELDGRISLTARLLAEGEDAEALLSGDDRRDWIARLDALVQETDGIDYVVIADAAGKRVYHPDHSLIGEDFAGGDEDAALDGAAAYLTTRQGVKYDQRRAFHSVVRPNPEGEVLGFVMVSASMETIEREKQALIQQFLLSFLLALAMGLVFSWLFARSVRKALLGHEPHTFAEMYLQRENVLDHLNECLLAVSPTGRILFRNARAAELFPQALLPKTFPLWTELEGVWTAGQTRSELLTEWAGYTFLAKLVHLDKAGALLILRDRTEYVQVSQQLTGTNHVIDALRANTHEFMNKLHVIYGLLQIGEIAQAEKFIDGVSEDVENNYQNVVRQLRNRTVAALVLGKLSHARELDIQLSLRRDSQLPRHSDYLSSRELVTIIGNLLENAFDAVKNEPLRQVGLFIGEDEGGLTITVDDSGCGMTEEQIAAIRARQYSSKGEGHGFGLRLIQRITAEHGGYLEIESEPGEGSAFTVSFVRKRERAEYAENSNC